MSTWQQYVEIVNETNSRKNEEELPKEVDAVEEACGEEHEEEVTERILRSL